MASLILGRLYSRYSLFYSRLSAPQEQSGYEGVKEIFTAPTPGIEPGHRARSHAPCRLSHMTPLRKPWHKYNHLFPTLKKHKFIVTSPLWTNAFPSFCKITMPTTLFVSQKTRTSSLSLKSFVNIRVWKLLLRRLHLDLLGSLPHSSNPCTQ